MEKEGWIKRNIVSLLSVILSLAIVVSGGLISYGGMKAQVSNWETQQLEVKARIAALEVKIKEITDKVDAHHTNATPQKHIDDRQWELLQNQITNIEQLLRTHMRRTGG